MTVIYGIDGDNIVGEYIDASNYHHWLLATIPEPATLLLLGLGLGAVRLRRKR